MAVKLTYFISDSASILEAKNLHLENKIKNKNILESSQKEIKEQIKANNKEIKKIEKARGSDFTTSIRFRLVDGRNIDIKYKTTYSIRPEFWNNNKGEVRNNSEFLNRSDLQESLNYLKEHILKSYSNKPPEKIDLKNKKIELANNGLSENKIIEEIKLFKLKQSKINKEWINLIIDKHYNPEKYLIKKKPITLFEYIQYFIDNSHKRLNSKTGKPVSKRIQKDYETTFEHIKDWASNNKEPDFIDMDIEFHQQFTEFLRNKGLKTNTIGKNIKNLKTFLNTAKEQGKNPYDKYKSNNFKVLHEEVDTFYLNKDELSQLYSKDLSHRPSIERVRDLFIIGCHTGLRFNDLKQVTKENIINDYIIIKQGKTGKKVKIPIHKNVLEILNKYNWMLPCKLPFFRTAIK